MRQECEEVSLRTTKPGEPVVIDVSGLVKRYGDLTALDDVRFAVGKGEIFAYLGPNGAGKTTTIGVLCGLLQRDGGEVTICGVDIDQDPVAVKQRIGVVPEESNLYPELTCRRNIEYFGELYGLPRLARRARAEELLATFGLLGKAGVPFRSLSRGMKRRLTVAAALVHSPEVLLLDEPTAGLDVPSARALRELISALNRGGMSIFLTTHNLAEAEVLSDRVLILAKGRVVTEGTTPEIRRQAQSVRTISVTFSGDVAAEELSDACPAVRLLSQVNGAWQFGMTDVHTAVAQLVSFAERSAVRIEELSSVAASLEDAFVAILEDAAGRREAAE